MQGDIPRIRKYSNGWKRRYQFKKVSLFVNLVNLVSFSGKVVISEKSFDRQILENSERYRRSFCLVVKRQHFFSEIFLL